MNTNLLTPRAKKAIKNAEIFAREKHHSYIGAEHLLIGVLRLEEGNSYNLIKDSGINPEALLQILESKFKEWQRENTQSLSDILRVIADNLDKT